MTAPTPEQVELEILSAKLDRLMARVDLLTTIGLMTLALTCVILGVLVTS